ncbi:MAG TPA: type III pantothenate kinase [Chloroflexia bacterium]|nr:type III pantothenate kinase [Chloroflexia bacterium]
MLLAIDVGNTNTVLGLYDGEVLVADWRMSTVREKMADEWASALITLAGHRGYKLGDVDAAICSSVVPPATTALREMVEKYLGTRLMLVEPGIKTGVKVNVDNPREVGADRIVNTIAAHTRYGGPAIVIDFGTATTFDVVSPDGEYLGGAISPGLVVASDALFRYTAQLRRIELVAPRSSIGKNTVHSMQSGVVWGYVSLVEGMVARIKRDMGEMGAQAKIIGTGGLARLIAAHSECMEIVDDNLTLDGLRIIYDLNRDA